MIRYVFPEPAVRDISLAASYSLVFDNWQPRLVSRPRRGRHIGPGGGRRITQRILARRDVAASRCAVKALELPRQYPMDDK
jgi:hypothetical protein